MNNKKEIAKRLLSSVDSIPSRWSKINALISVFMNDATKTLYLVHDGPAPAWINMETCDVFINQKQFKSMLEEEVLSYIFPLDDYDKYFSKNDYYKNYNNFAKKFIDFKMKIASALVCHEIAHKYFSPERTLLEELIKQYAGKYPPAFVQTIVNIVEDAYIQKAFIRMFPAKEIKESLQTLQEYYQGKHSVIKLKEAIDKNLIQSNDVYHKLYYFITRGYAKHDPLVQSMYNHPELFIWKKDTVATFDKLMWDSDTKIRLTNTLTKFIPLLWRDLNENKITIAESGNDNSQQNQNNQGNQKGQGNMGKGNAIKNEEGEREEKEQGGNNNSNNNEEEQKREREKEIEEGAKKLGEDQGYDKHDSYGSSDFKEKIKTNNRINKLRDKINNAGIKCRKIPWSTYTERMDSLGWKMYCSLDQQISKIFNCDFTSETNLKSGEIDPDLIIEWATKGNLAIYKQETQLVQEHDLALAFFLDYSGSMCGRIRQLINVTTALVHAFSNINIDSIIYGFTGDSFLIKDYNDPIILNGNSSNVYYNLNTSKNGCTDALNCFKSLSHLNKIELMNKHKILFFITDGITSHKEDISDIIKNELIPQGWNMICIGLDLDREEMDQLADFTAPAICKNYTDEELSTKLGNDLYNLIMNDFILNKK